MMSRKKLYKNAKAAAVAALSLIALAGCSAKANNTGSESSNAVEITEEDKETNAESDADSEKNPIVNSYVFTPLILEESIYGGIERENGGVSYTVKYQSAVLDDETAEIYPKLADILIKDKDAQMKGSEESIEAFKETADFTVGNAAYEGVELTDEILTSVVRSDPSVLSLKKESYWYNAGAHGFYYTVGANYDPKSGEKLKLNDVIKDTAGLIAAAKTKLKESYPEGLSGIDSLEDIINTASDKYYGEEGFDSGFGWTIGYNQLELYFNPYTLGSYAEGQQVVGIRFDEYPELFNEKYIKNIPAAYAYKLSSHEDIIYEDIDKDGKNEEIRISMLLDGNGLDFTDEYILEVSYKNKTYSAPIYSYPGYENYFVKSDSGNSYIYSFAKLDNDYIGLNVCEIVNGSLIASNSGNLEPAVISYAYTDGEGGENGEYLTSFTGFKYALTNPERFILSSRLGALSTYDGYRNYYLNEDGMPISNNPYNVNNGIFLKLKKEFEFEECYHNGKRTGKKILLPEGTELYIHLTDGLSYVVLGYGTDEYVYAEINANEYPQPVNGVSSEEVFDGMFYAG